MSSIRLGRVQLRIMHVLWQRNEATAREITDALNTDALNTDQPIAHSTVQTLLRGLEVKKAIDHKIQGRTFVFYPLVREEQVAQSVTRELLDRVFDGSVSDLVAYLLKHENVSADELREIRRMINERSRK